MIEETLSGPGVSAVQPEVVGNFTGGVRGSGSYVCELQSRIMGATEWEVVEVFNEADDAQRFRGFEPLTARKVEYRFELKSGAGVSVWLQG